MDRTWLYLLGMTTAFMQAQQQPGNTARSRACHSAWPARVQHACHGLGVLSHGPSAVPYLARCAGSCSIPLSPPSPAGITGTLLSTGYQRAGRLSQQMGDTGRGFPSQESWAAVSQGLAQSRLGTEPP